MEGAPKPLSTSEQLDKMREDRSAYVRRLTTGEQSVGSGTEVLEANAADAQLERFDKEIRALEEKLAQEG